jgi:Uma2 family endonuclease
MSTARMRRRRFETLTGVSYAAYVEVRDHPGNRGKRMTYHDGVLEIMAPELIHDDGARNLFVIVFAYCKAFQVPSRAAGSTTFRRGLAGGLKGDGKEPDESFYLGDAATAIVGKTSLDLTVDPPPSLWIEVDNWGTSASKLPLYARLGVSEVWRYRVRRRSLWFGHHDGTGYTGITTSHVLPGLTSQVVLELLDEAKTRDLTSWGLWLEATWFPAHRQELIDRGAHPPI